HQVVSLPRPGAAQERLLARIMFGRVVAELVVVDRPARQRAGSLLHVGLGEVADAEREELHQLAGQVLVGVPLAIARGVEIEKKGRLAYAGIEELAERRAAEGAERLVLLPQEADVVDLLDTGGEVIVPHQRELFGQWVRPEEHAEHPPRLEPAGVAGTFG